MKNNYDETLLNSTEDDSECEEIWYDGDCDSPSEESEDTTEYAVISDKVICNTDTGEVTERTDNMLDVTSLQQLGMPVVSAYSGVVRTIKYANNLSYPCIWLELRDGHKLLKYQIESLKSLILPNIQVNTMPVYLHMADKTMMLGGMSDRVLKHFLNNETLQELLHTSIYIDRETSLVGEDMYTMCAIF